MQELDATMMNQSAAVVTGALLCALFAETSRAEAQCRPAVVLQGDPKTIKQIKVLLKKRGIDAKETPGCPSIEAKIDLDEETGLVLWMKDSYGRTTERVLSDVQAVTTLLESWARTDITAPLLAVRGFGVGIEPSSQPVVEPAEPPVEPPLKKPGVVQIDDPGPEPYVPPNETKLKWWQTEDRGLVYLGDGFSLTSEFVRSGSGFNGFGLRGTGCTFVGPLCVGTLGRVGSYTGDNKAYGDIELILNAPLRAGKVWIAPALAGGIGFTRRDKLSEDLFLSETRQLLINSSGGLRGEALLQLTTPLSPEFLFEAGASLGVAINRGDSEDSLQIGQIVLRGDQEVFLRGFIGVRYKVP